MDLKTIKKNGVGILRRYLPNLFLHLDVSDIENFIEKGYNHSLTLTEGTPLNNFLGLFLSLVMSSVGQGSVIIIREVEIFNHLLGEFHRIVGGNRNFKNLLQGNINDFKQNNFLNTLSEVAALLELSKSYNFLNYEYEMSNGKSIDFELEHPDTGKNLLIDVVSLYFDPTRYENKKGFRRLINYRIKTKYDSKTKGLTSQQKKDVYIFPVFHDISGSHEETQKILRANKKFLLGIKPRKCFFLKNNAVKIHFFVNLNFQKYNLVTAEEYFKLLPKK